jgi:hypothetical protein
MWRRAATLAFRRAFFQPAVIEARTRELKAMTSDRDRFVDRQTKINDELARLTPADGELAASFAKLARETYDILVAKGAHLLGFSGFVAWPESAGFFLRPWNNPDRAPPSILERWREWETGYPALEARNPPLQLRNLMQTMSEALDALSWPQDNEWRIESWVAEGDFDRAPYILDTDIYARLRVLHARLKGWLYQDSDGFIHFAELPDFLEIGRQRGEARREMIRLSAERHSRPGPAPRRVIRAGPPQTKS